MRKLLGKCIRVAGYIVTILVICVAAFALFEYASGTQPFYVVSDNPSSMSPTVNYGDLAVIYKAPFSSLSPGTIIAFHDPRGNPGIILHRIAAVLSCSRAVCLATKGDNNATNPTVDPWNVTQGNYVGQAVLIVPYLGYVSPALWGFSGTSALMPVSVIALVAVLVRAATTPEPKERRDGGAA